MEPDMNTPQEVLILPKTTNCRVWSERRQQLVAKRIHYTVEHRPGLRLITIQQIDERGADRPGTSTGTRTKHQEFA
jgi:hypothetical protein